MNSYQLCITGTAKKFARKIPYKIVLAHVTGSPPRPRSASGTSPYFTLSREIAYRHRAWYPIRRENAAGWRLLVLPGGR